MTHPTLRVAIVDDHAMFRRGVRAEIDGPVEIVAEAEDVESAVHGRSPRPSPTSCCSTCTCPAGAGSRSSAACTSVTPT